MGFFLNLGKLINLYYYIVRGNFFNDLVFRFRYIFGYLEYYGIDLKDFFINVKLFYVNLVNILIWYL